MITNEPDRPSTLESHPKRVLCYAPYNMWTLHGMWEMTILHALKLRGAEVHYVLCDGLYSDCDVFWAATNPRHPMSCPQCQARVANLANSMQMPFLWLGRYLFPDAFREARQWVERLSPTDFIMARYQDWNVGKWVESSVHSHLRISELDFRVPQIKEVYQSYLYSGLTACLGINRLLDDYKPDVFFLFNGRQSSTRVALEIARKRGIRVICHERGNLKESLGLTENVPCFSIKPIEEAWQLWKDIPLKSVELENISQYMHGRQYGKNLNWRPYSPELQDTNSVRRNLGLDPDRPLFVLFSSSDDEIIAHKEWQGPFSKQMDWIKRTVNFAERHPELDLVIRVHPNTAGKKATGSNFQQSREFEDLQHHLSRNVRLVMPEDPISSYSLMDLAHLGLVYMSTVGLEMACKGKNVIVAGGGWLYDQPFVKTVHSAGAYEKMLEAFLQDPEQNKCLDIMRMAYRYAYSVFFRLSIPFPLVKMPDPHTGKLAYNSLDALLPGKEPNLDRIARVILENERVFLPPTQTEKERSAIDEEQWLRQHMAKNESSVPQDFSKPKVSVVIPCYNYGKYLEECVKSVIVQTYQDFEIIIVNDGSTDNTKEVAERLIASYPSHRIKLINQPNSGQPAISRNVGIESSKGRYILCLDADDILPNNALSTYMAAIGKQPSEKIVVYGSLKKFEVSNQIWKTRAFSPSELLWHNHVPNSSLYSRRLWEINRGYATNCKGYEDWDYWIRSAKNGATFIHVDEITTLYREAGSQSLQDYGRKHHEWNIANIVLNNPTVYEAIDIDWALEYLAEASASISISRTNEFLRKHIRVYEKLIKNYPELYRQELHLINQGEGSKDVEKIPKGISYDYVESKRIEETVQLNLKVLSLQPENTEVVIAPGKLFTGSGKLEEARKLFRNALEREAENDLITQQLERLSPRKVTPSTSNDALKTSSREFFLSVVITTYNRQDLLKRCLDAFAQQSLDRARFEVIVVDDGSDAPCEDRVKGYRKILDIRYIFQNNAGLAAARNTGISVARGDVIVPFDDDNFPDHDCLDAHYRFHCEHPAKEDAMLGLIKWDPSIEITPLMHYITEVNPILWSYKNITPGQVTRFGFLWGGCSSYKKSLIEMAGGFNPIFKFGYEDTEAELRMRNHRLRVYYNPKAVIYAMNPVSYEGFCKRLYKQGQSLYRFNALYPDRDLVKNYASTRNADKIIAEFKPRMPDIENRIHKFIEMGCSLPEHSTDPSAPSLDSLYQFLAVSFNYWKQLGIADASQEPSKETVHKNKRAYSILILAKELPFYDRSSGNFRLFQMIRILAAQGHAITFLARPSFRNIDDRSYIRELEPLGVTVIKVDDEPSFLQGKGDNGSLAWLLSRNSFDICYLVFYSVAELYIDRLRELAPQMRIIIDSVDIHFLREKRRDALTSAHANPSDTERNKARELAVYRKADVVVVITDQDRQALLDEDPGIKTAMIPNIHPSISSKAPEYERRQDILFVGGFTHDPNVDAVEYFCSAVWPMIAGKLPACRLIIAGNAPPARVMGFASERVIVTGYVQNLQALLDQCRVSIAPLRFGAGMKGKVGESLAGGLPVVATSVGAEGMGLIHGETVLVADTPQAFAQCVIDAYLDKDLWNRLSTGGKSFIEEHFSPKAVAEKIHALLDEVYMGTDRSMFEVIQARVASYGVISPNNRKCFIPGTCNICGSHSGFVIEVSENEAERLAGKDWKEVVRGSKINLRENMRCVKCPCTSRHRALVSVFLDVYKKGSILSDIVANKQIAVFESSGMASYTNLFDRKFSYINTMYDKNIVDSKAYDPKRYADLQQMPYGEDTFDYIITADVFEHVRNYLVAIRECFRVLKPGGTMIFTVPYRHSQERNHIKVLPDGDRDTFIEEPEYHGMSKSLVYRIYGRELLDDLAKTGFAVERREVESGNFCFTTTEVFVCRKPCIPSLPVTQTSPAPVVRKSLPPTIAIKCCTPSRQSVGWGDTYFAESLARAFEKIGYPCRVDYQNEWYTRPTTDIVIHVKGLYGYKPSSLSLNVIWMISHPELIAVADLKKYELLFCASEPFTQRLSGQFGLQVHYLPQASDPDLFKPIQQSRKDYDLLFVGNNYDAKDGACRKIISDLSKCGMRHKLAIVGQRWKGFVDNTCILGDFIDYHQLPCLYSLAKIVLNDHHKEMQREGFINNRTFDLALGKVFQISDPVDGMGKLSIVTYDSPVDLKDKIEYYLENPTAREAASSLVYEKCQCYTFGKRALEIAEYFASRERFQEKHKLPFISVIIPTYNRADMIKDAIESALSQEYNKYEIFIVDDGSTDHTAEVVQGFASGKIRYLRKEHSGAPATRNLGIAEARGEFILWLDSDDVLLPGTLNEYADAIKKAPDVDVLYGDLIVSDASLQERGKLAYKDWYGRRKELISCLIGENPVPNPGVMIRKNCYERFGNYDPSFTRAHDYEFWTRIARKATLKHVGTVVAKWRLHDSNWAGGKVKVDTSYEARVVKKILERYSLRDIYPDINWGESENKAQADALSQVAIQFMRWGDLSAAVDYLRKSHQMYPTEQKEQGLHDLEAKMNAGMLGGNGGQSADKNMIHSKKKRLTITYLISNILGVTGGNQTLLNQVNALIDRGHRVHIVTYSKTPDYFTIKANIIQVPPNEPMSKYIPKSEAVISTYFANTAELIKINAPVRIYYAQGDQFIFEDETLQLSPELEREKKVVKEISKASYLYPGIKFVANSHNLANAVEKAYGRKADAVLPVCVDSSIFHPLSKEKTDGRVRILVVGPDTRGNEMEPLIFKGMGDIREALDQLSSKRNDFVVIRMSNTQPLIFKDFPCECHIVPNDQLKTFLYGTADILVYASHYDSCPRPPMEAMASGTAVVCTETSGALEYCRNEENCLLVPIKSPGALCDSIERVMDDKMLREKLVRGGFETAGQYPQKREWDELENLLHSFYHEVVKPRSVVKGLTSIVVVLNNEQERTRECIQSIEKFTLNPYEVVLVCRNSKANSVKGIREVIKGKQNYKFIEGDKKADETRRRNQGIEAARGEHILLLENDVVVTENWLSGMLECLNSYSSIGIVGPMTNNIRGSQKVENVRYTSVKDLPEYAKGYREKYRHRRIPLQRVGGFCMLFRRELVDRIGLLDESFGAGNFEDDDFCLRAELAGYRNCIAGDVFIHHYGSRSFIGSKNDSRKTKKGFLEKWNSLDPRSAEGKKYLSLKGRVTAKLDYEKGQPKKAVDRLLAVIRLGIGVKEAYYDLAELLLDAKQYDQALRVSKQMPDADQDDRKYALLGYCQEGLANPLEAQKLAEQALSLNPSNALALNLKGILSYRKGDKEEAQNYFQRATAADPGFGEPHTNLGVIRWEENRKEEALHLFERGFILSPAATDIVQMYHVVITKMGEFAHAEQNFREAQALHPFHKRIRFFLIDILLRQGKNEEAMEQIEQSMSHFGIEDEMLRAALEVRKRIGPQEKSSQGQGGRISLCMIVKDEENDLLKCLRSVKPVVDELIVVDTGSTDRTKDIATALGAKVFEFPWENDFSAPRNFSISQAKGDWILALDADEVISPLDHASLLALTKGGSPKAGYSFVTRNYLNTLSVTQWTANDGTYDEEAGSGWIPSDKVRLFPRDRRIHFENPVHEFVEPSLERNRIPIKKCSIPVHHYGKLNEEKQKTKWENYFLLGKKKLEKSSADIRSLRELAVQANILKRYEEAAELWHQVIRLQPKLPEPYFNLASIYMNLGKFQEASANSKKAIELDPGGKEAVMNYSIVEFTLGNIKNVISALESLLSKIPEYPLAMALLSVAYRLDGEREKSQPLIAKIKKTGLNYDEYLQNKAKNLIALGRSEEAGLLLEMTGGKESQERFPAVSAPGGRTS